MSENLKDPSGLSESFRSLMADGMIQSPCPIMITDLNGLIQYVNPMFMQMTGYSLEELKGKTPRILKSQKTPSETHAELWKTILSGAHWSGEICNKRKSGEEFWESISISGIRNDQGEMTHFISVWQDITLRVKHDESELQEKEYYQKQSLTDELTGVYNRRHIFAELDREFDRARRYGRPLSGMMIDVDNFKKMNDVYGHLTGDRILRTFAKVLSKSIRSTDILGRYGGDEFLIVLPETNLDEGRRVAERIRKNLQEYQENVIADFGMVTASIGLVALDESCRDDKAIFIDKIDRILFLAKRAGKNTVVTG